MSNRFFPSLAVLLLVIPTPALAQQARRTVDQAVEDLDPLATSLRRFDTGLYIYGERRPMFVDSAQPSENNWFVWRDPITDPFAATREIGRKIYSRVGPGYYVRFDRPSYLMPLTGDPRDGFVPNITPPVDGAFLERIPADAVFDLRPIVSTRLPPPAKNPYRIDASVRTQPLNYRVEARIDGRVKTPSSMLSMRRTPATRAATSATTP